MLNKPILKVIQHWKNISLVYISIISILVLCSIFLYFYINQIPEIQLDRIKLHYKIMETSYNNLDVENAGEYPGFDSTMPLEAYEIIRFVRKNQIGSFCIANFSEVSRYRIIVGSFPSRTQYLNGSCTHFFQPIKAVLPRQCKEKMKTREIIYATCNNS